MKPLLLASAALVLATVLPASLANAAETPTASRFDPRIRYVTYNPADVVRLDAVEGQTTHIVLEEGESYVFHVFGDAAAWSFAEASNHVFIKPTAEDADTNLTLVTDRRSYNFELAYSTRAAAKGGGVYQLTFHYPETASKARAEAATIAATEASFAVPPASANLRYTMSGSPALAPINVWDDGRFTYFKFPPTRDVPAVYMVDADGSEAIVNRNSVGAGSDVVVVQKINDRWRLRLGNQVLAVVNEAYDPMQMPIVTAPRDALATGTSSPLVQRVVKGADR